MAFKSIPKFLKTPNLPRVGEGVWRGWVGFPKFYPVLSSEFSPYLFRLVGLKCAHKTIIFHSSPEVGENNEWGKRVDTKVSANNGQLRL